MAHKLAKKPAKATRGTKSPNRDETISAMEPMLISESSYHRTRLNELVFELTTAATAFKASLPEGIVDALCDLVRSMNCYYSNLIEGHNTHPIGDALQAGNHRSTDPQGIVPDRVSAALAPGLMPGLYPSLPRSP